MFRCSVFAEHLVNQGCQVVFFTCPESRCVAPFLYDQDLEVVELDCHERDEPELIRRRVVTVDALVVDHYNRGRGFEEACSSFAHKLLAFEDYPHREHHCDLLLDPTYGRRSREYQNLVPEDCRILCGPEYAVLRPQFRSRREEALTRPRHGLERLLITLGATDAHGITEWVVGELISAAPSCGVDLVLGANLAVSELTLPFEWSVYQSVSDMASLMVAADLSIGTAGSSSWERCCLGLPSLLLTVAENQEGIATGLADVGAASYIGCFPEVPRGLLARELKRFSEHPGLLAEMSSKAAVVCDGEGAVRLAAELLRAVSEEYRSEN